jgi:hypothetical protein
VAALLTAAAVILAVSGGFRTTVGGLRVSARSPLPILALALINFSVWLAQARRANAVTSDLELVWVALHRHSRIIVGIAAIAAVVSLTYSTRSAAGADASGYLSEAQMISQRRWIYPDPLHLELGNVDGWLTTPLGWQPTAAGAQVPTYAPGLPLLMAVPHLIAGINGASAVVIASAVIAIICTGVIAAHLGGSIAGIIAASLIAFTPVFIYQSIQPMSDVPVTAAWMLCFALLLAGKQSASGWACAVAVLIRPNLAPLAIVPLILARRRLVFAVPVAIAALSLALMQWTWYGSPLRSGYGATEDLFSLANVMPNLSRYSRWWLATAPALLLAVFGVVRLRSTRFAMGLAAFGLLVIVSYLIYAVFDDWAYLRFLLPALAAAAIFASIELAAWIERQSFNLRVALLFAVVIGVNAYGIWIARSLDTFKLADQLSRVWRVADYINANLPPNAVLVAGEQSGAMRYYTGRSILRWEAATPDSLNAAFDALAPAERSVFIVLDAWEEGPFRLKLAGAAPLDWPPMLEAGSTHRTRVWRLQDRARYLRGEPVDTVRLR